MIYVIRTSETRKPRCLASLASSLRSPNCNGVPSSQVAGLCRRGVGIKIWWSALDIFRSHWHFLAKFDGRWMKMDEDGRCPTKAFRFGDWESFCRPVFQIIPHVDAPPQRLYSEAWRLGSLWKWHDSQDHLWCSNHIRWRYCI